VRGIDVSVHQRTISWKAIKAAGLKFAYLKATEGVGFTDASFVRHKAEAKKVRIPVGAYHYARPDTNISARDPILEADYFVDVVRPGKGDLLPALDFEEPGLPPAKMREWTKAWLARVHERTGVHPLFYVSPGFWNQHLRGTSPFPDCPLWLAQWGPNDGQPHSAVPIAGWSAITVHQFTSNGRIAGFGGRLDLNLLPGGALKAITIGAARSTPEAEFGPPLHLIVAGSRVTSGDTWLDPKLALAAEKAIRRNAQVTVKGTRKS
jgi:lysozyme